MRRVVAGLSRSVIRSIVVFGLALGCGGGDSTTGGSTVATVTVSHPSDGIVSGQTIQLTATPKDAGGSAVADAAISWTVTPSSVATVNGSGVVAGVASGTATVTAQSGGKSGTTTITVMDGGMVGASGGTLTGVGGAVTLIIPPNALSTATPISIQPTASPAAAALLVTGSAMNFGPSGTQFAQPVTVKLHYTDAQLQPLTDPSELRLFLQSGNSWTAMPGSSVDTAAHVVTGTTTHFSTFASCQEPCGLGLPAIYVNSITSGVVAPGGSHTFSTEIGGITYLGRIALELSLLPQGVTATMSTDAMINDSLGGEHQQVTIVMSVAPSAPTGHFALGLRVTGTPPTLTRIAPIELTIVPPGYTITPSPASLSIEQGGSWKDTLTLTRLVFPASIAFTAESLPPGVTALFAPPSTVGDLSVLTLNVAASAPPGGYSITIRGRATGLNDVTLPLFVNIVHVAGFEIAGTPASVNVPQTGSASTGLQATRFQGFAGAIVYAVSGLPAGLTAAITPTSVADSMSLTFTGAGIAPGSYPVTITATSGSTTHQVTVTVGVAAGGQLAVHLDYSGCTGPRPVWLAFQDGAGAFTQVASAGDVYDFTLTSAKGAIAVALVKGSGHATTVTYGTQGELALFGSTMSCAVATVGKTVNASTVNPASDVDIDVGGGSALFTAGPSQTLPLFNVALGPQDATAFLMSASPKMILRRDQDIPSGGSLAPFDFGAAEAFTAAVGHVSVTNANVVHMGYFTRGSGCPLNGIYNETPTFNSTTTFYGVPSAFQRPADLHAMYAGSGTAASSVTAIRFFHAMADQSIVFGATLSPTAVSIASTASFKQLRATATFAGDYQSMNLSYFDATNSLSLIQSTAYAGSSTIAVSAAGLVGAPGFLNSWAPAGSVQYTLGANSLNLVTRVPTQACTEGLSIKTAALSGTM